jgi:hypothetical protein
VADKDVLDLLGRSSISFTGTVVQLAATTMTDLAADANSVIVSVDQVLHAPDSLKNLAGSHVTVQLKPKAAKLNVGDTVTLFTDAVAFGDSLVVSEVGRVDLADVAGRVMGAAAAGAMPLADLSATLETNRLTSHARGAAAVVSGRVTKLAKAGPSIQSEHDPDWWVATLAVNHVELGDIGPSKNLKVLYANSRDVSWRTHLKPKAGQEGAWILHAADPSLSKFASFSLDDEDDLQSVQFLDSLRPEG